MPMTIPTQAVREMAERLASWSGFVSSGYECPAAGTAMHAAHVMLLALVEERNRLAAELDHQLAERAALTARAEAAEAALRESEANRILLDALIAELKAEKQPTLGRFATLLRRATTKVNRAALQGRDGDE